MADSYRLSIIRSHLQLYSHPNIHPIFQLKHREPNSDNCTRTLGLPPLFSLLSLALFGCSIARHWENHRENPSIECTVYPPFRSLQLVSPLPTHPTTIEFKLFIISILPRDATIFYLALSLNFLAKVYRNCVKFSQKEATPIRTVVIWRCQNCAKICGNGKRHFCFNPLFVFSCLILTQF